jgi:SAM-dependent methyltransferase
MLIRIWRRIEADLIYSVRRRLLDESLTRTTSAIAGEVIEIGGGRKPRRGRFRPATTAAAGWLHLDIAPSQLPHVVGDATALPFAAGSFDTVLCLEVLEYLAGPRAALAEMRRIVRPGGRLVLSVPFLHRCDGPTDRWRATEHGLRELLSASGWACVSVEAQGAALAVMANILQQVLRQPTSAQGRVVAAALWPLVTLLRRWDQPLANRFPLLASFSTGFLAVAEAAP